MNYSFLPRAGALLLLFFSFSNVFAQWTTVTGGINYAGGKVGIGVATPLAPLHLANNNINRKIVIHQNGTGDDHQFHGFGVNSGSMRLQIASTTNAFRFWAATSGTASNEVFTILGTGQVGIGVTAATSYKLAVAGKIGAWGEVKVQNLNTTFPDYVFEKSYRLRSLEEVESYIQAHHHLPEIPSAQQVESEGMGLVEMNTLAIKKIEELTLYLIDLKKENQDLRERLEKLEKQTSPNTN